jgi:hypothetical protein
MTSADNLREASSWGVRGDTGFRPDREGMGDRTMTRRAWGRVLGVSAVAALVAAGTGLVYHAFIDRWEGDVRAPLVAAAMAGIAFFVFTLVTLSWVERREVSNRREPQN